ncbi:MAG: DNA polymerase III subunit delta [Spirochaetales bacterium]|nr:DNA polymerase III subunit delta [Spirochaetales bacterium]
MLNDMSLFLLLGPEEGEKGLYIQKLVKKIGKAAGEKPEIQRYYFFEAKLPDLISKLLTGSLFSQYIIMILSGVEQVKKQQDLNILVDYLKNPNRKTTLILVSESIGEVSRKISDAIPASNRVIFWELNESQKRNWLFTFFKQRQFKIEPDVLNYLLEAVENNTKDLRTECQKLVTYYKPGSMITLDDIESLVFHSREENPFTLFERFASRDFVAALETLDKILLAGEVTYAALLSGLLYQIRNLMAFKQLSLENFSRSELFARLNIRFKKSQKLFLEADKNYSYADVNGVLILALETEKKLRSERAEIHKALLKIFLYQSIMRGGRTPSVDKTGWYGGG